MFITKILQFQSTLPIREETILRMKFCKMQNLFQSTLPIREETYYSRYNILQIVFQSTLPIREETSAYMI